MPINITMPALSPTMEEGNLSKWLVKEGDKVSPGDVIAEIETDKATMEVEAVDEGTVAKLVVPAGTEGVKVNALIAILAGEGEDAGAAAKGGGDAAPAKADAKQDKASISPPVGEMSTKSTEGGAAPPTSQSVAPPSGLPAISPTRGEITLKRVALNGFIRRALSLCFDACCCPRTAAHFWATCIKPQSSADPMQPPPHALR
ncbi:hypothetical protein X756_19690 [Mesorhizobium sp. LSHC412B00]|nr:hypothetical protein X756_19690 [Mesorhizobium sp. LSHC412B00]